MKRELMISKQIKLVEEDSKMRLEVYDRQDANKDITVRIDNDMREQMLEWLNYF